MRRIGSVSGRGVWRILPLEQRLWAMGQPSASAQHVPGRVPVWYSLPHCPSAGSPGTRFLSEKPPSQAPSHPWWSSALTLLFFISALFWRVFRSRRTFLVRLVRQVSDSPPLSAPHPRCGCLQGQGSGQGRAGLGQARPAGQKGLLCSFSPVFFLLPVPFAFAVGISSFSSLSPSQDARGPDKVAQSRKDARV